MSDFIQLFFAGFFGFLGVSAIAPDFSQNWAVESDWKAKDGSYVLVASTKRVSRYCSTKDGYLTFPQVVHSYQQVSIDGSTVASMGDPTFRIASPFYRQLQVECSKLVNGNEIRWEVTSYSKYFARVSEEPHFSSSTLMPNFFNVTANVMAFGILVVLSIFTFIIYKNRVPDTMTYAVSAGALLLSCYFFNVANEYFGIKLSMLASHKLADVGLWFGGSFFLKAFFLDGLMTSSIYRLVRFSCYTAVAVIVLGQDGDQVQFGTLIPMLPYTFASGSILYSLFKLSSAKTMSGDVAIKFMSVVLFVVFGLNDVFHIMGIINSVMMLSIGIVGCVLGLSIAVVHAIKATYQERDDLLHHLEDKVSEKTVHLEQALLKVKATQAELVQSAKLASLGTLSAGIAHEINNSINYVNGALTPLERKVLPHIPDKDRAMVERLLAAIKEGTALTVEIVKSLRNYTGLNQSDMKEFAVGEAIDSVTTILKSKLREVELKIDNPQDVRIYGNLVAFNQIFMNFITNSLDAFDKPNSMINITCGYDKDGGVFISYRDNGSGIPQVVVQKVFDPFFTTKEVGKGTGLGLHIVKKEVERHGGQISVQSEPGKGTEFLMSFPKSIQVPVKHLEAA